MGAGAACASLASPHDVAEQDSGSDASATDVMTKPDGDVGTDGTSTPETSPPDAPTRDESMPDSSMPDALALETSTPDTSMPDTSRPDTSAGCMPLATPAIVEFAVQSTLSSGPAGIVLGSDGNIWFALGAAYGSMNAGTGSAIGRISPDGSSQTSFMLPTAGSGPAELVAGPDGNIWFTEFSVGQIGHIAPDGTGAVEYPLPAGSKPNGIAVGPDGNMWFTDSGNNSVGWIAVTGGTVTEIPLPESDSLPAGIQAAPDGGDVWFSEQHGNRIAKIAAVPDAGPTEYTIPTTVNPHGFTFGPDGNIWFTEFGATGIGRMTPGATFTEFPVGATSWRIVAGADDNLWFTENAASEIGRVTLGGAVSAWPVPTGNSDVNGIAVGPNGTVWFTEFTSNKIGRVTICQ
jgi:streptogramin lyase